MNLYELRDCTDNLWELETSLIGSTDFQRIWQLEKENSAALPVKMKWLSIMVKKKKDLFLNKDVVTITYKKWEVWQLVETLCHRFFTADSGKILGKNDKSQISIGSFL